MDDSHTGAFGLIAIVLLLFFKIHAIESIDNERWRALLAAPILGRWAMVLLGYRSQAAKARTGFDSDRSAWRRSTLFVATFITLLLVAAVLHGTGIAMMIWVAIFALASKKYFHRRLRWCNRRYFRCRWRIERDFRAGILCSGNPMSCWQKIYCVVYLLAQPGRLGCARFSRRKPRPHRTRNESFPSRPASPRHYLLWDSAIAWSA